MHCVHHDWVGNSHSAHGPGPCYDTPVHSVAVPPQNQSHTHAPTAPDSVLPAACCPALCLWTSAVMSTRGCSEQGSPVSPLRLLRDKQPSAAMPHAMARHQARDLSGRRRNGWVWVVGLAAWRKLARPQM